MKRALISLMAAAVALGSSAALAAEPATFLGDANAVGLELTLQGSGLTIGYSEAVVETDVQSDATAACEDGAVACAIGAGELALGEIAKAWWPGNAGTSKATAFELPGEFSDLLTGQFGEAVATATDTPSAVGQGGVAEFSLTATQTLYNALPEELRQGLEDLTTTLEEQAQQEDPTGIFERAFGTLDQLRENIEAAPILQLYAGGSDSSSIVDGDRVTSTAEASGSILVVAPFEGSTAENPEGLVIVTIGESLATATTDQFEATADFTPAIATLSVLDVTTGEYDTQTIEGDTGCALEDTPLEICVTAGSGATTVEGSSAAARADAVRVEAFPDTLALSLRLASAETSVAATPPTAAPAPGPEEPNMPRTGGGFVLPGLLLLGGALGVRRLRR